MRLETLRTLTGIRVAWLLLTAVGLAASLTPAPAAQAAPTLAVELISFTAVGLPDGVRLTWQTATELNVSAFFLQRTQQHNFENVEQLYAPNGQPYPDGIIESEGNPTYGATYIADDLTAVSGQTYTYRLIEVEENNQLNPLATVLVTAGGAPTATLIPIGNHTPAPGGQVATQTPPPGSTPQATAANNSAAVAPTATRPFITATAGGEAGAPLAAAPATLPPAAPSPTAFTNTAGVALAQTLETPESAYPDTTSESAPAESAYPVGAGETGTGSTPLPEVSPTDYPATTFTLKQEPTPTIIGVVGSQATDNTAAAEMAVAPTNARSVGLLWLGFLAGILIFIMAVFGSMKLFARRRD